MIYVVLLSVVALISILALPQQRKSQIQFQTTTSFILLVGLIIGFTTIMGLASLPITQTYASFLFLIVVTIMLTNGILILRSNQRQIPTNAYSCATIIPFTFGALLLLFFIRNGRTSLTYLLNTWDGTSNPGLVTNLRLDQQFDYMSASVSGWEAYPSGAHMFVAWLANAIDHSLNSYVTLATFAIITLFVYTMIIFNCGALVLEISTQLGVHRTVALVSMILFQSVFISNFMIEQLLLLHSLSFMTALLVVIWHTRLALIQQRTETVNLGQFMLLTSVGILVVVNSYTYLLPILLVTTLQVMYLHRRMLTLSLMSHKAFYVMTFLVGVIALYHLVKLLGTIDATNRFSAQGHIIAIPWTYIRILFLGFFALGTVISFCQRGKWYLVLPPITLLLLSEYMWVMSESRSRTYGLNYYAKKMEFALVIVASPFAFAALAFLVSLCLRSLIKKRFFSKSIFIVVIPFFFIVGYVAQQNLQNKVAIWNTSLGQELLNAAVEESKHPGLSAIWTSDGSPINTSASLLGNYLDITVWKNTKIEKRQLVLVQQMQRLYSGSSILEMCEFLAVNRLNKGRVHLVQPDNIIDCSTYRSS